MKFKDKYLLIILTSLSLNSFGQAPNLLELAKENDSKAQLQIGRMYANGDGVPKNPAEAVKWISLAANSDNADAIALLGNFYAEGFGLTKDQKKAVELYKKSIDRGSNRGMVLYGNALIYGNGVAKEIELGHQLIKTAVKNNSPYGKYVLGIHYLAGSLPGDKKYAQGLLNYAEQHDFKEAGIALNSYNIINNLDPNTLHKSYLSLKPHEGKNDLADIAMAYYLIFHENPASLNKARSLVVEKAEKSDLMSLNLMIKISQASKDYQSMIKYMQEVNNIKHGTYDIKSYIAEINEEADRNRQLEAEKQRQKSFIETVAKSQSESIRAENDMQRGGIKSTRDKFVCQLLKTRNIKNWEGYISKLSANSDGLGVLSVEIAQGITLKTWNNSFSDITDKTLIQPESKLFNSASQMRVGQKISFSGMFIKGDSRECVRESSISLSGSLRSPEYIFKFSEISAIN